MTDTIAALDAIVTGIGSRGVFGQETPCTISVYQESAFVADLEVHLREPQIMEQLTIELRRKS